ncbi:ATP-binding protein [Roseomonas sp. F4]
MPDLFQLDLPNRDHAVPVAQAAARQAAALQGLPEAKLGRLELAVEELVGNAVRHAYPAGREGLVRVRLGVEGARLILHVQDWGLPYTPSLPQPGLPQTGAGPEEGGGLGLMLAFRMADEALFENLGREGKRFDLRFRLPPATHPAELPPPPEPTERRANARPTLRAFQPEDAPGIARCAWLAYGYTKPDTHLYDPEELIRRNAAEEMLSFVAVAEYGSVLCHLCLDFGQNPLVPECTDLVLAPEARGHVTLVPRLFDFAYGVAAARGLLGGLAHAVTAHTVSQRGALRCGGQPVNVHLGSVSTDWAIAGALSGSGVRQSEIAFYRALRQGPPRVIHPPARHRQVLEAIYATLGEPATIGPPGAVAPTGETLLSVAKDYADWGHVVLALRSYGADAVPVVAGFLRGFCLEGVATVLLELPLADPATAAMAEAFEALGFSFCGLMPHGGAAEGDDLLLYQYLNNIVPQTEGEQVIPACRPLYDYVLAERRRVDLAVFGALPFTAG